MDDLSARNLVKYGLRRGVYSGANKRRFVLFEAERLGMVETRREFDTKRERDDFARMRLECIKRAAALIGAGS